MVAHLDSTRLFYTTHGAGAPLLVMHGGPGLDHTYFRPWLDALGRRLNLHYYDHRGNGRSARPTDWSTVDHTTWVDDAEALRQHLGFEHILLMGHSYGGFLAQEYALRYGDRLEGLILCSTAPVADYAELAVQRARARATDAQFEAVLGSLTTPVPDDEAMAKNWRTVLPIYFHDPDSDVARQSLELADDMHYSAGAYNRAMLGCLPHFNTLDRLKEITTPTLVITTDDDWISPPAYSGERLYAGLPNAEHVHLEACGHFPFVEQQAAFTDAVVAWLDRLNLLS